MPSQPATSSISATSLGDENHDSKKVAIIGSGCAGLGALWALNRTHHDVYIYEAADRLGGHTNTVEFKKGKAKTMVDTGFIVLNTATYPNFIAFLKAIKVPTVPTEMTFGVSRDQGTFEWAGTSLSAVFAQRKNIFFPRLWRMIFDIIRFNQFALDLLKEEEKSEEFTMEINGNGNGNGSHIHHAKKQETIGEYLDREGYSDAFRDDYLIPMAAAVWSTSPDKCSLEFPAITLVRFMWNHHLLSTVATRPSWLTIRDGAKAYVDAIMKGFPPNHIFLNTHVESVTNDDDGRVRVHLESGKSEVYDHVIIATHGDQAHALVLPEADHEEKDVLSGFNTSKNTAILHSDLSLMPRSRKAWSSWNYITKSTGYSNNVDQVCLTYNMNILQHIQPETFGDVLVTLNPLHEPDPALVQGRYSYSHPLYNAQSIRSQSLLPRIQNTRGISYCGAWTKYGFHEDGFSSGIKVAQDHLGAQLPFKFRDSTFSRGKRPVLGLADLLLRALIMLIQLFIVIIERIFRVERGPRNETPLKKGHKKVQ
ncbi:FAD/NAD(P)-binding domain-containing protein [Mollisia scopiformis]|uniref:FAD/NAD(P)-binding domain-containing protein n=1 Tax=Mollisia scopiformis TaxID=149040 RepID=A0A194XDG2_MOLSC|nr:FAD/NAD(P)-binding domain-containing protein [Mollisia scopiformis]KUJ18213.1 FAD/NAD(P)-binding domain-containing protein [Mollisia scopiformis]